jgi:hypothetical protein
MQGAGIGLSTADRQLAAGQLAQQGAATGLAGTAQGMQGAQIGLSTADRQLAAGQLAQQGFGTGLAGTAQGMQGSQIGLQGIDRQLAGTAQGMQGAGMGLQGVNAQLAGTAQGMQGAGMGLQGVSGAQAGYGLANQTAATLGQLGNQQLAAQTGILGLQNQIGGQQQAQEQAITNQAIQNYAQAQEAPMTALNQYNALLRGYAVPGTTTAQYQAQPSLANQLAGYGTAAVGASQLMGKKKGGTVRSGIADLGLYNATSGAR